MRSIRTKITRIDFASDPQVVAVAQLVEPPDVDRTVMGSSPISHPTYVHVFTQYKFAVVAQ